MAITIGAPMTLTVQRGATRAQEGDEGTHRHATEEASTERPKPQAPVAYPTVDPAAAPAVMTVVSK